MKKIQAQIVADSISPQRHRITSMLITFPRFILAEAKTHRIVSGLHGEVEILEDVSINSFREGSKNSASSRAIPFEKMVKMVEEDPFIPLAWQKDHKGMQGTNYYNKDESKICVEKWVKARDLSAFQARSMNNAGITKQLCNRLLEPFMWHTVLVTATEFSNFFELRAPKYKLIGLNEEPVKSRKDWLKRMQFSSALHPSQYPKTEEDWWMLSESGAEIHIQALAEAMWDAMNESTPKKLESGQWHIPFGDQIVGKRLEEANRVTNTGDFFTDQTKIKIATARCARLSYMTFDGELDYEKDIKLHDKLLVDTHLSPFEHCARAMNNEEYNLFAKGKGIPIPELGISSSNTVINYERDDLGWCNNFRGFIQYRYLVKLEEIVTHDFVVKPQIFSSHTVHE